MLVMILGTGSNTGVFKFVLQVFWLTQNAILFFIGDYIKEIRGLYSTIS